MSALDSRLAPVAPSASQPGTDHRAAVAHSELAQPADADRPVLEMLDDEIQLLASLALRRQPHEIRPRLGLRAIGPPREPARHLVVGRLAVQRGGVVGARDPHPQRRTGDGEVFHGG